MNAAAAVAGRLSWLFELVVVKVKADKRQAEKAVSLKCHLTA